MCLGDLTKINRNNWLVVLRIKCLSIPKLKMGQHVSNTEGVGKVRHFTEYNFTLVSFQEASKSATDTFSCQKKADQEMVGLNLK